MEFFNEPFFDEFELNKNNCLPRKKQIDKEWIDVFVEPKTALLAFEWIPLIWIKGYGLMVIYKSWGLFISCPESGIL